MGNTIGKTIRSVSKPRLDPETAKQVTILHEKELARASNLKQTSSQDPIELKDTGLLENPTIDVLIKSLKSNPMDLYSSASKPLPVKKKLTGEEKEALLQGRLLTSTLRGVLEEVLIHESQGRPIDVHALSRKYGAKEDILERVLRNAKLAPVEKAPDGRLVAQSAFLIAQN